MEEVLLNVMYEVPSREDVAKVVVTGDVVLENVNPTLIPRDQLERTKRREKSA
jgi:ATP-dependent Clp protease ATP-binding subunit ClpX